MFHSNNFKWLCMGLAAVAFASCSSSDDDLQTPMPSDPEAAQLSFNSNLRGLTRATETAFENEDEISLFAVAPGEDESIISLNADGNYINNVKFRYNGSQFVSDPAIYKRYEDKFAYFAVYPYLDEAGPTFEFKVANNQDEMDAYKGSDLCTATTGYTTEAVPTLTFSHRLSYLVIDLEGNNLGADVQVELPSVYTNTKVDLNSVRFEASGNRETVVCNENGTNSWRAIIAPQTIAVDEEFLKVTVNGREHILKSPRTLNLTSGKKMSVTLRVVNDEIVMIAGDIYPWDTEASIEYVIPDEILDKMEEYIDIYPGVNPPNIESCYYIDPISCVFCEDEGNGGYSPGDLVTSKYSLFRDQDMTQNTINYSEVDETGRSASVGNGAFISGEGNNFSVFFNTEGVSLDISIKTALVISGTKTANGIKNLKYAFVMLEKGDDPEHLLMDEGVFRVFEDLDGISEYASWPESIFPLRASRPFDKFGFNEIFRVKK